MVAAALAGGVTVWVQRDGEPTPAPVVTAGKIEVNYFVSGDSHDADLEYRTGNGTERHDATRLPFRTELWFEKGAALSLRAQGTGTVMCTVTVNDEVVAQVSGGKDGVALCTGQAGVTKALAGAVLPPGGPELRDGEVRLRTVVPIQRFPGRASPTDGRVTDKEAHLSYAELGGVWKASRRANPEVEGFNRTQGFPVESAWDAVIASGVAGSGLMKAYKGDDRLRALVSAALDERQSFDFQGSAIGRDVASQSLKISGHPGWVMARELRYTKDGEDRMTLLVFVAVDTGNPRPSFILMSIPEPEKRHWPDINTVIDSIRVD
ncbi:hypothetical protein E1293_17800 [Actinomadura darangshiensis]|uniref:Uncharacterized protein n=1 Tax=Actinomadura darangshiensis TaxID=705336 RepID=A0A4R5BE35_9ACTN|nr:hypothetical protein [Actinomadura darangshiensis]TDD81852.1 hypothetical protein E1293_17800 [Actinomadura darangshiensis]